MLASNRIRFTPHLLRLLSIPVAVSLLLLPLLSGNQRLAENRAEAAVTVWSIGTLNDSKSEFSGSAGTFTVGTSPTSAFPARLSGANVTETINFTLGAVSGDYFLNVVAADSSQNSTSGLQATVNGHKLTPRWAGAWEFSKWGNGGTNQGVQTLRWALNSNQLVAGANTLQLRVSGAPNAGPNSLPDGVVPYFDMDYVSLEQGSLNLALPKRYSGSTEYWMDDAIYNRARQISLDNGTGGAIWIDFLMDRNTLDSDIEMVEEQHWTASYPDLTWEYVEPAHLVWDDAVWNYYHYTYKTLRDHGVQRILAKIQYTPRWASTLPTAADYAKYPPTSDTYWIEFIKEVALRVGDVVDDYAIMNEVNTDGFWKGTQADYERLEMEAYDTLKQWDTIDANGDGVAAFVAPSASNEPGQTGQWQEWYAAMHGKMDAFHTHDYKWGIKPAADIIQAIDPSLQYIVSETGPANWFINETAVPEYNPAATISAIGYLLKDPTSPVDFLTQWLLRGDPDKDALWPNASEWFNSGSNDPYSHNDGYTDTYNSSMINIEPPGPPYTNWMFTSSGAYWAHWDWVLDWDGPSVPVEVSAANGDWQYEADAVQYADRIEVITTNFEGGMVPAPHTISLTVKTPWTSVKVDTYDPDDFTGTTTVSGPTITLTAPNLALDLTRWVLSNASAPNNATPGVFIAAPIKSATVAGNVTINADAYDDGTIAAVEYRIDPFNNGAFIPMTFQSGNRYTATWNSAGVPDGDHSIQVRVRDSSGKSSTVAHVVKVVNGGGPTPTPTSTPTGPTATPTATPTRTNTPVPTNTPTRTNTPSGPTNTPTATFTPSQTPTRTNTPVSATATNTPSGATNLALNKVTTVSSFNSVNQDGTEAVDGNVTTYWRTQKGSLLPAEWIVVDLGSSQSISSVTLKWNVYWAIIYDVQVSTDNVNWTTVFSTTTGDGGTDAISFAASTARYVRLYSTAWNNSSERLRLNEIEVYQ